MDGEDVQPTEHPRVRVVKAVDSGVTSGWLEATQRAAAARDTPALIALICAAVPEFTPSELISPAGVPPVPSGIT